MKRAIETTTTGTFARLYDSPKVARVPAKGVASGLPGARDGKDKLTNRRRRKSLGFALIAILPTTLMGAYLYGYATDQYVSEIRFSVRQQVPLKAEGASMASALGGGNPLLAIITDSETVVQYLSSRQVIDDLGGKIDMDAIYAHRDADLYARMGSQLPAERRLTYWKRMVDPYFDMSSGVITVKVRAFDPTDAQKVAATVLTLSENLVNNLSARARSDTVAYADSVSDAAEAKLKSVEDQMAKYRNEHAVLFPQIQATGSSSVETSLRESAVQARATMNSLVAQGASADAPQVRTLKSRVSSLETEIANLQSGMTRPGEEPGAAPLASVLGGYNSLETEEKIYEKVWEKALASQQDARNAANQQSVYLNAFVKPALPQESTYPVRWKTLLATAMAAMLAWAIGSVVLQGVKDHVD